MALQSGSALYSPSQLDGAPEEVPPWRRFDKGPASPESGQGEIDGSSAATSVCRSTAEGAGVGSSTQVRDAASGATKDGASGGIKRRRRFDVRPEEASQQSQPSPSAAQTISEKQKPKPERLSNGHRSGERGLDEERSGGEHRSIRTSPDRGRNFHNAGDREKVREEGKPRKERWSDASEGRLRTRDIYTDEELCRKRGRGDDEFRGHRRREFHDEDSNYKQSRWTRKEGRSSEGRASPARGHDSRRSRTSERRPSVRSHRDERRKSDSTSDERGNAATGTGGGGPSASLPDSSSADFTLQPEELERQLRLQREQQRQNDEMRLEFEREVQRQLNKQLQQSGESEAYLSHPQVQTFSQDAMAFNSLRPSTHLPQPLSLHGKPFLQENIFPSYTADTANFAPIQGAIPSSLDLLLSNAAVRHQAAGAEMEMGFNSQSAATAQWNAPWKSLSEPSASAPTPAATGFRSDAAEMGRAESAVSPTLVSVKGRGTDDSAERCAGSTSGGLDVQNNVVSSTSSALDTSSICQRVEKLHRLRLCLNCKDPLPRSESALDRSAGTHAQGVCKGCLRHVGRAECKHCGIEFLQHRYCLQAETKLGRPICIACIRQMSKHRAEPSICRFCQCWSAWNDVNECERCRSRIARHGLPKKCQRCGVQAAFPHSRELPGSEFRDLCFLCHCFLKKEISTQQRNRQRMQQTLQLMRPGKLGDSLPSLENLPVDTSHLQGLHPRDSQNPQSSAQPADSGEGAEQVEAQLRRATEELVALREQLLQKDLHILDVNQRNANQEKQLQLELEAMRRRAHQLTLDIKRVEANSEAQTAKFLSEKREVEATHASQLDALHVCVDQLKARNDALEKESQKHVSEVQLLKRHLALASRDAQEIAKKLESASSAQKERDAEVQELKAAVSLAVDSKKELNEQLRDEQRRHTQTKRALREAQERLSQLEARVQTLESGNASSKDRGEAAEDEKTTSAGDPPAQSPDSAPTITVSKSALTEVQTAESLQTPSAPETSENPEKLVVDTREAAESTSESKVQDLPPQPDESISKTRSDQSSSDKAEREEAEGSSETPSESHPSDDKQNQDSSSSLVAEEEASESEREAQKASSSLPSGRGKKASSRGGRGARGRKGTRGAAAARGRKTKNAASK